MRFPFSALGGTGVRRPVIDVQFGGHRAKIVCLVDSGALGIRADMEVADALGIDASIGVTGKFSIGGFHRMGWTVPDVEIKVNRVRWLAPVTFIENFNEMPVLGLLGFFDHFDVTVAATRGETRLVRP